MMKVQETTTAPSAFIRADQPWGDALLAPLYDVFPFEDDLPLYRELADREDGRVLEVACGSGRVLVSLAQAGNEIVGLDASPYMLALAREKLAFAGSDVAARARLFQGDMRTLSLCGDGDEPFALAIVAVKSIAYLVDRADQLQTLEAIAAHLRPGGLLAIDLLHPTPDLLAERPGSVRQDLAQADPDSGTVVMRTETLVSNDLAAQVRLMRSAYEIVERDGSVTKRIVEWPYRYLHRFEAEHLLERAGFTIEALYGGYRREPFTSDSPTMLFLARTAS
jgi:SAM-dependent methyltransferase